MPKVSICIPTYNSARFLGAAIESALSQTYADFELVISDNASTDDTPTLCSRFDDPRLKYHRFETLVGQGGNWNRCVALAQGDFVALLHADDTYQPDFLAARMAQFDRAPAAGFVFGAVDLIDEEGRKIGKKAYGDRELEAPPHEFYGDLLVGCIISPASVVVRRSCYAAVGPFNEQHLWGIDWDMWLRLAAIGGVSYTPVVSSCTRLHLASGSSTGLLGRRYLSEDFQVLKAALDRLDRAPELASAQAMRRPALRSYSMRAVVAAEANCEAGRRLSTLQAVGEALWFTPGLATRPTIWGLVAGALLGPEIYRRWKGLRGRLAAAGTV